MKLIVNRSRKTLNITPPTTLKFFFGKKMPHYYLILIGALNIFFQGTLDQGKNAGKQGNKVVEENEGITKKLPL